MENTALRPSDLNLGWDPEEEVLDVLDLPQLYQRPSTKHLLDTLSLLTLEPRSWESTPPLTPSNSTPRSLSGANTPARRKQKVRSEGVPQYLTRIISSPLAWLASDEEKEEVWVAASTRLSERAGRTGMGALTRSFRIPVVCGPMNPSSTLNPVITPSQEQDDSVEVSIHEPALTEDNLGLKTWASSFVLARKWRELVDQLPGLPERQANKATILELGAGTGLVGIAAAAVLRANVLLTDLPDIVPNLERNIESNDEMIDSRGGSAKAAVLDWTVPEKIIYPPQTNEEVVEEVQAGARRELVAEPEASKYPLVVSADPIYSPQHPEWLVQTIGHHLERNDEARAVVIIPIREAFAEERNDFRDRMTGINLVLDFQQTDMGFDDWSEGKGDDLAEVECWTTVWKWKSTSSEKTLL